MDEIESPGLNRTVARADAESFRANQTVHDDPHQYVIERDTPTKQSDQEFDNSSQRVISLKKTPEDIAEAYWKGMKTRKIMKCKRMINNKN